MSVYIPSSTADLRSSAQDYKRDAAHKHKWALGAVEARGRAEGHPRPQRPRATFYNFRRAVEKSAVASIAPGTRVARKHTLLDDTTSASATTTLQSDDSAASNSDDQELPSPALDAGVMYSFDAPRAPTQGSQILNHALAQAVERFEEKETTRLVKNEYDVLDSEGESMGLAPSRKKGKGAKMLAAKDAPSSSKAKALIDEDEYEFV